MTFNSPEVIVEITKSVGLKKVNLPLSSTFILGFLAGAYILFGFLLYIRITATIPKEIWGSIPKIIGAALFPLGLVLVLLAGDELLTGNFMTLIPSIFSKKTTTVQIVKNWTIIAISNFAGAGTVFFAYLFGHKLGLTETGPYLTQTIVVAKSKVDESFLMTFISGIGASWLVCLAVWLGYAAKDTIGKITSIFAGTFNWMLYLENFFAVFLGNALGGVLFVGSLYWVAYKHISNAR